LVKGDEFDLASLGEPPGIFSESARCHDETTNSPFRRHHTVEFPHDRNADLSRLPLLALDHIPVVALSDDQVDATIRAAATSFINRETARPEKLADQQLKLLPRHGFESAIASSGAGNLAPTGRTFAQMEVRAAGESSGVLLMPESRSTINKTLREQSPPKKAEGEEEALVVGILRAVHLDKDWLDVTVEGISVHIAGLKDTVDDLIGPMVNRRVIVRATKSVKNRLRFIDIELDE